MSQFGFRGSSKVFEVTQSVHPELFFGRHPSTLTKGDLYRENGNIGWKRIEASTTAEAYGPVVGDQLASAAVFNFDQQNEAVVAAFRILTAKPDDFTWVVEGVSKAIGKAPRYASKGSVMRAVFENGAFVTADGAKVTVGWSQVVTRTYASANAVEGTEGVKGAP